MTLSLWFIGEYSKIFKASWLSFVRSDFCLELFRFFPQHYVNQIRRFNSPMPYNSSQFDWISRRNCSHWAKRHDTKKLFSPCRSLQPFLFRSSFRFAFWYIFMVVWKVYFASFFFFRFPPPTDDKSHTKSLHDKGERREIFDTSAVALLYRVVISYIWSGKSSFSSEYVIQGRAKTMFEDYAICLLFNPVFSIWLWSDT